MGIYCEINLHRPPHGVYMGTAGNIVSGTIKYAVDEEIDFTKIVVSLKGLGSVCLEEYYARNGYGRRRKQVSTETYLDIDHVIQDNEKGAITPIGSYEIPFSFKIPHNVPPSVSYNKHAVICRVMCCIKYYVRIKFNRRGIMNFTKRFKKPITMVSGIVPRLPTAPIIYGEQKKLTQLFTFSSSYVNIKANITNSVLRPGGQIRLHYELTNNTKLTINGVEIKLVEVHDFYLEPKKPAITEFDDISGTDTKTSIIKSGETQEMTVEINVPLHLASAEFSTIYSRQYAVLLTSHLPLPHRNHILKIPLQIGYAVEEYAQTSYPTENPPSYWESMNEYKKDKIDLDELDKNENASK